MSARDSQLIETRGGNLPIFRVGALTLLFVAAYFVLRALPDADCGFLLYEEVVGPDGQIEFCATNHAGFLDLSFLDYPIEAKLKTDEQPLPPSRPAEVRLRLETTGGMPIAPHELARTHTKKMHVMVVDASLEDYHHVHPDPVGLDGDYRFEFVPGRPGPYRVFTEVVPLRTRRQLIALSELPVEGEAGLPRFERKSHYETDGLRFELSGVPEVLDTGRDYRLRLDVMNDKGVPAVLETVMGTKGHMVAFDAAGKGFAHMHPIDSIAGAVKTEELAFLFNVPNAGWYRLFAQVQVDGRDVYGRFDLRVD